MFTGLIENRGRLRAVEHSTDGAVIVIETGLAAGLSEGESVCVNGVCLTANRLEDAAFAADVMRETLSRTSLGELTAGDQVNLELAVAVGDRLGGHIVQGHVDCTGVVSQVEPDGLARALRIEAPNTILRYVVEKGSIAIDGASLTVTAVGDDWFAVSIIPETIERTTLGSLRPGEKVNLEADVLAKHVERLLHFGPAGETNER